MNNPNNHDPNRNYYRLRFIKFKIYIFFEIYIYSHY